MQPRWRSRAISCHGESGHYVSVIVSAATARANPSGVDLLLNLKALIPDYPLAELPGLVGRR